MNCIIYQSKEVIMFMSTLIFSLQRLGKGGGVVQDLLNVLFSSVPRVIFPASLH